MIIFYPLPSLLPSPSRGTPSADIWCTHFTSRPFHTTHACIAQNMCLTWRVGQSNVNYDSRCWWDMPAVQVILSLMSHRINCLLSLVKGAEVETPVHRHSSLSTQTQTVLQRKTRKLSTESCDHSPGLQWSSFINVFIRAINVYCQNLLGTF